jgi:hypothetical protein
VADSGGFNARDRELELYKLFRDYVKHEDDLINNRLNWNFTIQGFLFAAYAFSLQKIADVDLGLIRNDINPDLVGTIPIVHNTHELRTVMLVTAGVGFCVSIFIYLSVWAARVAIDELEGRWFDLYEAYRKHTPRLFVAFVTRWRLLNICSGLSSVFCFRWLKLLLEDKSYNPARDKKETTHGTPPKDNGLGLPGLIGGGSPQAHRFGFQAPSFLPLVFVVGWFFLFYYASMNF